jgi:hypothetical protein
MSDFAVFVKVVALLSALVTIQSFHLPLRALRRTRNMVQSRLISRGIVTLILAGPVLAVVYLPYAERPRGFLADVTIAFILTVSAQILLWAVGLRTEFFGTDHPVVEHIETQTKAWTAPFEGPTKEPKEPSSVRPE